MSKTILTYSEVSELLEYAPETGALTWKPRARNRGWNRAQGVAKHISDQGYITINIKGRPYRGHRIAWLLHYGEWPAANIDHINRVRSDNRISNLRVVEQAGNMQNTSIYKTNKSGHKGVFWHKEISKWWAYIDVGGKRVSLGRFSDKTEAISVRKEAEQMYHQYAIPLDANALAC